MTPQTPTLEQLPDAYNQLQAQFTNAQQQIYSLQNDLRQTRTDLWITEVALQNAQK